MKEDYCVSGELASGFFSLVLTRLSCKIAILFYVGLLENGIHNSGIFERLHFLRHAPLNRRKDWG